MKNDIFFKVFGRYALFSDPVTRVGGEKCSYHIPTYEALKGIAKSIYWKPTFVWIIEKVRVLRPFRTQTKGAKPIRPTTGGNDLSIYTYLADVEYQVQARFVWNEHRPELARDRIDGKHYEIARRMKHRVDKGVYVFFGSINPQLAERTGFSDEDAAVLKAILPRLFENDASSARPEGSMAVNHVLWWEHANKSGQYSSARVHRSLTVNPDSSYALDGDATPGLKAEAIAGF